VHQCLDSLRKEVTQGLVRYVLVAVLRCLNAACNT
jgi:hypothetical protein